MKPRIGLTLGDPAGIGPEVIRAALLSSDIPRDAEYFLIGAEGADRFTPGVPTRESALHALAALEEAAERCRSGELQGVVTGPISKKSMHEIGFDFPGQTEFFASWAGVENFAMCLTGGKITVALVTAHVPLREVRSLLSKEEIERVGVLLTHFLRLRGLKCPRVAVAGYNPHAGEGGDLGREEIEIITPAVEMLKARFGALAEFSGPHSPDTVFCRSVAGEFDGILCMYHDQGLIPLKLHAFDQGVNVTLGLPFFRTSPDHGTAFEIAGKGVARPDSTIQAVKLAVELAENSSRAATIA